MDNVYVSQVVQILVVIDQHTFLGFQLRVSRFLKNDRNIFSSSECNLTVHAPIYNDALKKYVDVYLINKIAMTETKELQYSLLYAHMVTIRAHCPLNTINQFEMQMIECTNRLKTTL